MRVGRSNVEALTRGAREDPRGEEIHEQPDARDDEHPAGEDLRRVREPLDRFDEDPDRDHDEGDSVGERSQDLGPPVAEAPLRSRRAGGQPRREQRERNRRRVTQHVTGVCEERQAVGGQTPYELDHGVGRGQREHGAESAPAARAVESVAVVVAHFGGRITIGPLKSLNCWRMK